MLPFSFDRKTKKPKFQQTFFLAKFPFNCWVGMFHGVAPGAFTHSHILNHHKHENSYLDVYCTAYRPRDSFSNFVKYIPAWAGYYVGPRGLTTRHAIDGPEVLRGATEKRGGRGLALVAGVVAAHS